MKTIVVGIAECRVSNDPLAALVTYALGSCIAVGMYDPVSRVGGLLHYLLPDSKMDLDKARRIPATFGDTGIPLLIEQMAALGASRKRLRVRIAGGARMLGAAEVLNIGQRNYLTARKTLWRLGILLEMEAVGGNASRNLGLDLEKGDFWVKTSENTSREVTGKGESNGLAGFGS